MRRYTHALDSQRPVARGSVHFGIATRFILQWLNDNYKYCIYDILKQDLANQSLWG
jgi:hypothetical protein